MGMGATECRVNTVAKSRLSCVHSVSTLQGTRMPEINVTEYNEQSDT